MEKNIIILFEQSLAVDAESVMNWLIEKNVAHATGDPIKEKNGFCQYLFIADIDIAKDSAIIFVSNQAIYNTSWQKCVKAIPMNYRLIPAGTVSDIDYNDPEILPPSIEEINFIILNEHKYENILDSLITSPEFYQMKNLLLNKFHAWRSTNSDGDLLSDGKQIANFQAEISKREKTEQDSFLKAQLSSIQEYLAISDKYAKKIRKTRIFRWVRRSVLSVITIALIVAFLMLRSTYNKLTTVNFLLSYGIATGEPKTNAIKMVEAFRNPLNPYVASKIARERLVEYLDISWEQTPTGYNYKYLLNDCAIPKGTRYLWTSSENGDAILWDTYTGEIKEKTSLTNVSLCTITLDSDWADNVREDEQVALNQNGVAIDEKGCIYLRISGEWRSSGLNTNTNPHNAECLMKGNWIITYDTKETDIYKVIENGLIETSNITCDDIDLQNVSFQRAYVSLDGRVTIAFTSNSQLYTAEWDGERIDNVTRYPVVLSSLSVADMKDDLLIVTDEKGQVYCINGRNHTYKRIPLILEKPISIRIINDETIIYHERNQGTRVYDLNYYYDYGNVLASYTVVQDIKTTEQLLILRIQDTYYPVSWSEILPVQDSYNYEKEGTYKDLSASDKNHKAVIKECRVSKYGLICIKLLHNNQIKSIVLDPARVLNNESGYKITVALQDLPSEYNTYNEELFLNKSTPTVIGIRYVPANDLINADFSYLLVGMEDGTFFEVGFEDSEEGYAGITWKHQIPSRAPICTITEIKDGYLLTDKNGQIWKCGSGANLFNYKGAYEIVNRKLHSGITQDLWDMLSPKTREMLNLRVYPGGDGKVWE